MTGAKPTTVPCEPAASAHNKSPVCSALRAASQAVADLKAALAAVGITLPSIGVDLPSCTSSVDVRPLVELVRCNLETARRLVAALDRAAIR